ncbi:MAG TPA: hypothetical protein VHM68_00695 [Candidatus Deferrimicrobium sp.]|nr:hypothetical protein [Candidatus Deferrimicrobium sp.]
MRLRIDGCDVSLDLSAGSTFGAVLAEAGRRVASEGRVVSRIVVDGREISTRFEREMADRPIGEIDAVEITTTTPDALFREALDGAVDLSLAIRRDAVTILSSLRAGDLTAAGPRYAACLESLGTFFQLAGALFNGIGTGVFPLAVRPGSAGELPTPPSATAGILQRLLRTQKGNDWNAVADILEREILPNIDGWSAFFKALKEIGAK